MKTSILTLERPIATKEDLARYLEERGKILGSNKDFDGDFHELTHSDLGCIVIFVTSPVSVFIGRFRHSACGPVFFDDHPLPKGQKILALSDV